MSLLALFLLSVLSSSGLGSPYLIFFFKSAGKGVGLDRRGGGEDLGGKGKPQSEYIL